MMRTGAFVLDLVVVSWYFSSLLSSFCVTKTLGIIQHRIQGGKASWSRMARLLWSETLLPGVSLHFLSFQPCRCVRKEKAAGKVGLLAGSGGGDGKLCAPTLQGSLSLHFRCLNGNLDAALRFAFLQIPSVGNICMAGQDTRTRRCGLKDTRASVRSSISTSTSIPHGRRI